MKERLKKELEIAVFVFLFITICYGLFYFLNIVKHPSITGMVVYEVETRHNNYTFSNSSLYIFNDSLINLSNGARLKEIYSCYTADNGTICNISYGPAIIDTLDFSPSGLNAWDSLEKNEILNNQNIIYYYSVDSGENWALINNFNLSSISSAKIRFRMNLTGNTSTPVVNYITLAYRINTACIENWNCENWPEPCPLNQTQTRACADLNECGSEDNKPETSRSCVYSCSPNWIAVYWNCTINNTNFKYYNDTNNCFNASTPSDNGTYAGCDYCINNWSCASYSSCDYGEKECLAVVDIKNCYNITGLAADNYTGDYDEFAKDCDENEEETESEASESQIEAAASSGESAEELELEPEPECSYDILVDIPEAISFINENNFKADIQNTGCKIDKLSFSLSDEFREILNLPIPEITELEKDSSSEINLSSNPVLTRTQQGLLIQGLAAKTIQKQIRNITGSLIIRGEADSNVKIDKTIRITAEVILFDRIELEKKSPFFVIIFLSIIVAALLVYLTTKFKFKFNIKK